MVFGRGSGDDVPIGEVANRPVISSFAEYAKAQEVVDTLSEHRFPVEHVAIVGVDLRLVESVLGRTSWARSAAGSGATFAWLGALVGLFVSFFGGQEASAWEYVLLGILYGAGFGIVFGLVSYGIAGRRRDFISRQDIQAARYDVVCDPELVNKARRLLSLPTVWPPPLPEPTSESADEETTSDESPGPANS